MLGGWEGEEGGREGWGDPLRGEEGGGGEVIGGGGGGYTRLGGEEKRSGEKKKRMSDAAQNGVEGQGGCPGTEIEMVKGINRNGNILSF